MNRRTRRRVYAVVAATVVGAGSPLWAPPLLRKLPTFEVAETGVVGNRFTPREEILARAAIPPDASVWDDPSGWEARVRGHPLVREARVRRAGLRRLEIRVREVAPVAFVAGPALRPVDGRGRLLPIDPARHGLSLPVVPGDPAVEDGRVSATPVVEALRVLARLRAYDPGFVERVSEVRPAAGAGVDVWMVEGSPADRILLPVAEPVTALRRVELALGQVLPARVGTADARFRRQVVFRDVRRARAARGGEGRSTGGDR